MIALGSNVEEMYIEFTSAELGREKTTINKSAIQNLKLIIVCKKYLFDAINSIASIENAEKVVKEPRKPIIKKYLISLSEIFFA